MAKKHETRRAPWMEGYTNIVKAGRGRYTLRLQIGHQAFQIGELGGYTYAEVKYMRDMLCIALDHFHDEAVIKGLKVASEQAASIARSCQKSLDEAYGG